MNKKSNIHLIGHNKKKRGDLFGWAAVEGRGIQTKPGTVEATKISGVSIKNLV